MFNSKTEYMLEQELDHVLAALMPSNRLVCRVCLHTGLRVSDVLALPTALIKRRFWVTEAKTGKKRLVGLPDALIDEIQRQAGETWAFPHRSDPKRHRTRQAVWADVKRASKAFRLPQNVGVHSLRKIYAVELLAKYGDIERVRRAMNHGNLTTTMIYVMADKLLDARQPKRKAARR